MRRGKGHYSPTSQTGIVVREFELQDLWVKFPLPATVIKMSINQKTLDPKEMRMWTDDKGQYRWAFGNKVTITEMYIIGGLLQDEAMKTMRQPKNIQGDEENVDETENDLEHNQK